MVGVGGLVDGGVDVVALAAIVLATNEELKLAVVLGLVDDTGKLLEASLVDDGPNEVVELRRLTDLESLCLRNQNLLELRPLGLGNIQTRAGAALLTLVLE